ncbi:MAG: hypothetical protein JSR33_09920 [Proteobacteria bacterium]|nr:hypothetical protein [Pseudomonadota bacterium]
MFSHDSVFQRLIFNILNNVTNKQHAAVFVNALIKMGPAKLAQAKTKFDNARASASNQSANSSHQTVNHSLPKPSVPTAKEVAGTTNISHSKPATPAPKEVAASQPKPVPTPKQVDQRNTERKHSQQKTTQRIYMDMAPQSIPVKKVSIAYWQALINEVRGYEKRANEKFRNEHRDGLDIYNFYRPYIESAARDSNLDVQVLLRESGAQFLLEITYNLQLFQPRVEPKQDFSRGFGDEGYQDYMSSHPISGCQSNLCNEHQKQNQTHPSKQPSYSGSYKKLDDDEQQNSFQW